MKDILYWEAIWWAGPQGNMLYDTEESAPTTGEGWLRLGIVGKVRSYEAVECAPSK